MKRERNVVNSKLVNVLKINLWKTKVHGTGVTLRPPFLTGTLPPMMTPTQALAFSLDQLTLTLITMCQRAEIRSRARAIAIPETLPDACDLERDRR